MAGLPGIQAAIDKGRGAAAAKTGQTYNVYRLTGTSTGQQVQPSNLVYTNFKASFKRISSLEDTEANMIIKVPIFRGLCDMSKLQIGDVLVENGFRGDGSAFTVAYERPLRQYVFMHTPLPVTITRPENNPNKVDSGIVPYSGMMKRFEMNLVLNNGMYSFASTGTPAAVYIGLQAHESRGDLPSPNLRLATDVKRQRWDVYTPVLLGVQLMEMDIVNAANGDRYYIQTPFSQTIGLQGWQLITEKLRV